MQEADRQSYREQFDHAAKQAARRREIVHHAVWRDGHLRTMSHRPPKAQAPADPLTSRGVQSELL